MEPAQGDQWPEARGYHSACALNYGEEHPILLVSGGDNKDHKVLGDMWILDVDSGKWTEVRMLVYSKFLFELVMLCLDLELVIICTDDVFVYCCYVYKYPMHDRCQLCVFVNYCLLSCGW